MKDPAVLFYISDWLTSTSEMDADARGWYLNLLLHNYDKKTLPNDIEKLAVLAGVKFSEFKRFEQVFEQVFKQKFEQVGEQRLSNPRTNEILRSRELFVDKRSYSGKLSYFLKFLRLKHATVLRKKDFEQFIKNNAELNDIDLKNEQVLEQVFEHLFELYRNGNGNGDEIKDWKNDFNLYLQELKIEHEKIKHDESFIFEQQKFYPNVDILLSIEKSISNYWGTDAGWNNKKSSRSKSIDWVATFRNALANKNNRVYYLMKTSGGNNLFKNSEEEKRDNLRKLQDSALKIMEYGSNRNL